MKYPSVTEVLNVYQDFSMVPEHILSMASERGSRVHAICASLAKKLFVSARQITADIEGYIQSFNQWFEYVEEVVLVEEKLVDSNLGFTGHPDLIVKMKGDQNLTLLDLKTPKVIGKTWRAQLAAYCHLATQGIKDCPLVLWGNPPSLRKKELYSLSLKFKIKRCGSLRLKQDGGFPIFDEYTDSHHTDFAAFLSVLNAWRYFKQ